ncbi:MAG: hypothetical protein HY078_01920 [Elusimicrobia bacterium]|nr:hypothetical protein [Elusimicrobiota bacterium]
MIHIAWRFRPKIDKAAEFESAYSTGGIWSELFSLSPDYRETRLLRPAGSGDAYLVIDIWQSLAAYIRFKTEFAREYERIDRACEDLTDEETMVGVFDDNA